MPGLKVAVIGGAAALRSGLSWAGPAQVEHIFAPARAERGYLERIKEHVDAVLVGLNELDPAAGDALDLLALTGLARRSALIAERADPALARRAVAAGVSAYLRAPAPPERIAAAVALVSQGGTLFDEPAASFVHDRLHRPQESMRDLMSSARALASALELKDTYTGGHAERVTSLALTLARAVGIPAEPGGALEAAFLLHDVGKIGIPESILNKPGDLSATERMVLEMHPILGERIIDPLGFPEVVRHVVRHHHERWDGRGYPDGLRGEDIPLEARLFTIADVIDAVTSTRPYRAPLSFGEAIEEVLRNAGGQFDPALCDVVVDTFLLSAVGTRTAAPAPSAP